MPRHIVLQSILLAEHIYVDTSTDKRVIAGTFHSITVQKMPAEISGTIYLYLCLRDAEPSDTISIEFVDNSTNKVLFEQGQIKAGGIPEPIELTLPFKEIKIPHTGLYTFDVFAGNRFLGAFRLTVKEMEKENEKEKK